jgi:hypothetical protein
MSVTLITVFVGALVVGGLGSIVGLKLRTHKNAHAQMAGIVILGVIAAISSGAVAANGMLVNRKICRNRMVAEERVRGLYQAAKTVVVNSKYRNRSDDSAQLKAHYKGPPFDEEEWQGMNRNLLRRNGYVYQVHIASPSADGIVAYGVPIEYTDRVKEGLCLNSSGLMQCPQDPALSPALRAVRVAKKMIPDRELGRGFMQDGLADGRTLHILTIIDLHTREAVALE